MIPRYTPALALSDRLAGLRGGGAPDPRAGMAHSLGLPPEHTVQAVPSARAGLLRCFQELAGRTKRRVVLVPAQICPVVPAVLVAAGFRTRHVDVDPIVPTMDVSAAARELARDDANAEIGCVLLSALYGHMAEGAETLLPALAGRALVLDLAQGLLLGREHPALLEAADASVYSFGLGKGVDTGGGLVASRRPLAVGPDRLPLLWAVGTPGPLVQAIALRAAMALGCYGLMPPILDRMIADDRDVPASCPEPPPGALRLWLRRMAAVTAEVAVARTRAAALFARPAVARHCHGSKVYGGQAALHLRQIVRLRVPEARSDVLAGLRRRGIDALPGGEKVPHPADAFPNACRFQTDSIRLPFLGRLSKGEGTRLLDAVEDTFDECLS